MMRTLIALLATAAISLPAAAQQTDMQQGRGRDQGSRPNTGNMERRDGGGQRATAQDRDRGGGKTDDARRSAGREPGKGERAGHEFRGRTGYRESRRGERAGRLGGRAGFYEHGRGYGVRGGRFHEEYGRGGREYGYVRGRRGYAGSCPRYIYLDGRRVLNERCLDGRGRYSSYSYYGRGPRYSRYGERSGFYTREFGGRRGSVYARENGGRRAGAYASRRMGERESTRNRGGERARLNERRGATGGGQETGQRAQGNESERNQAQRSARNRPASPQNQTESRQGR
jgi:hypothetical protein